MSHDRIQLAREYLLLDRAYVCSPNGVTLMTIQLSVRISARVDGWNAGARGNASAQDRMLVSD